MWRHLVNESEKQYTVQWAKFHSLPLPIRKSGSPSNTMLLGPHSVSTPNGTSIIQPFCRAQSRDRQKDTPRYENTVHNSLHLMHSKWPRIISSTVSLEFKTLCLTKILKSCQCRPMLSPQILRNSYY